MHSTSESSMCEARLIRMASFRRHIACHVCDMMISLPKCLASFTCGT